MCNRECSFTHFIIFFDELVRIQNQNDQRAVETYNIHSDERPLLENLVSHSTCFGSSLIVLVFVHVNTAVLYHWLVFSKLVTRSVVGFLGLLG